MKTASALGGVLLVLGLAGCGDNTMTGGTGGAGGSAGVGGGSGVGGEGGHGGVGGSAGTAPDAAIPDAAGGTGGSAGELPDAEPPDAPGGTGGTGGLPDAAESDAAGGGGGGVPDAAVPDAAMCDPSLIQCGVMCVDVTTDPANCGGCGIACIPPANAGMPSCVSGFCAFVCNLGFDDCDGLSSNGCEVHIAADPLNCGGCAQPCPSGPGGAATCTQNVCGLTCSPGFGDCDNSPGNGCETSLATDLNHCGACGTVCPGAPRASAQCASGTCDIQCNVSGWANCDGDPANGCETNLQNSSDHCGICNAACFPGQHCSGGRCN